MNKKNLLLKLIFQFSFIFLIVTLFYLQKLDFQKIFNIFNINSIDIIFFLLISNIFLSILFFLLAKVISKKFFFLDGLNIFLKGGLINAAIPGLGFYYKYKAFKANFNLSLEQYSGLQILSSFFSISSVLIIAIFFGFLTIKIETFFYFLFFFNIFIFILILIYKIKVKILYFQKLSKIYFLLSKFKKKLNENFFFIFLIFLFYLLFTLFKCYIFYKIALYLNINLNFNETSYLYLSSLLLNVVTLIDFIGVFEIILTYSASLIFSHIDDIFVLGFSFRLMNLAGLFLSILLISLLSKLQVKF